MVNVQNSKKVLFRLHSDMKKDFTVALVKQGVGAQHMLETFVERIIAFDKGEIKDTKAKSFLASALTRARELQAEGKQL